jgi:rare lipoprotein A (peptidoglycan hydrolase)
VHPDRVIDLDYAAFERIGNPRGGVLAVNVEVLSEDDPLYALGDELP